jgi:PAS domain-containing protein
MTAPGHDLRGALFDAIDVGLILLDGEHRVVGWNAWMESASGLSGAAVRGRHLEEVFPGTPRRLGSAIAHALELGASSLITHSLHPKVFPLRTRTGKALVHDISVRPVGDRPALECLLQVVDVTVTAGRERILRERQNARYDSVVGSAPDTILTLDAEGKIQPRRGNSAIRRRR